MDSTSSCGTYELDLPEAFVSTVCTYSLNDGATSMGWPSLSTHMLLPSNMSSSLAPTWLTKMKGRLCLLA